MDDTTMISDDALPHNGNGNGSSTLSKAKEQITPLIHQAQEKAEGMIGQTKGQLFTRLSEQKGVAAEGVANISLALRQASLSLQGQNQEAVGRYAENAADQLERFGEYLQNQDVEQILEGVQSYARRNPTLILGSTFALGFLAARFLKNAGPDAPSNNLPMRVVDTSPVSDVAPAYAGPSDLTSDLSGAGTDPLAPTGGTFNDTDLSGLSGVSGTSLEGLGDDV